MGSSLFMCSVDISNAFHSVVQSQVFLKLLEYGVNDHVVALSSFWCSGSFVKVRLTGDHLSRPIRLVRGFCQGSVLSPILFNTLTSGLTKNVAGGFSINLCDLSLLSYADNLLLLSCNLTSIRENIDHLNTGYKSIGLRVKALKTGFVEFCPSSCKQQSSGPTYVTVEQIKIFSGNTVKYLGITHGRDVKNSRLLLIEKITKSIRLSYGKLVSLKSSLNRKILLKLH
ncbi:uncharacterized protein LOC136036586 [Artemia franciscana]|uniref:uncharacterized protein LOC136036586 n=1 Tax=Artemia franciscana TaxID=6661 RepID=UPI0032DB0527